MMDKKAFTLVELLIVVIIIGILATLAVPQYNKMVEKTKWTEALNTLGAIRRLCLTYYDTEGEYQPWKTLNGSYKSPDIPFPIDGIEIKDPDAEGRYVYVTYGPGAVPNCCYAFIDEDGDGRHQAPEPYLVMSYDGDLISYYGAPEF